MAARGPGFTIPAPCPMDWQAMTPDTDGRFCAQCERTVIDLCGLSDAEVQDRLEQVRQRVGPGRPMGICIRVRPSALSRPSRRVLTGGMALLLAFGATGCDDEASGSKTGTTAAAPTPAMTATTGSESMWRADLPVIGTVLPFPHP